MTSTRPTLQACSISCIGKLRLKSAVSIAPLCLALLLGGCGDSIKMPNIFGEPDPRATRLKGKAYEANSAEVMAQEQSHMANKPNAPAIIDHAIEQKTPAPAAKVMTESEMIPVPEAPRNPLSYNTKNIFGKSLRSDSDRIGRLERAVQDMRNDFDSVRPSVTRLMALEGDIQGLIKELEKLNDSPAPAIAINEPINTPQVMSPKAPSQSTWSPKKKAAPAKVMTKKAAPPVSNGKASVYDVRIGEHPGKTRIVMDVNAKTGFSADIDNGERIMIVELPDAAWSATMSKTIGRSPYISSYKVEPSGNGHLVIFQLKKNAKISSKSDIGGSGSSRRLVIDVSGG